MFGGSGIASWLDTASRGHVSQRSARIFICLLSMTPCCVSTQSGFNIHAANNPVTVDFTTAPRSFAQTVVIQNADARPLYVDWCGPELERKVGPEWRHVRVPACAGSGRARIVAPHDSVMIPVPFYEDTGQVVLLGQQARFTPGVYRVVFSAGRKIGRLPDEILDRHPAPSSEFLVIAK